jgi:hypothetical protein
MFGHECLAAAVARLYLDSEAPQGRHPHLFMS